MTYFSRIVFRNGTALLHDADFEQTGKWLDYFGQGYA